MAASCYCNFCFLASAAVWIDGTDHGLPGPWALRSAGRSQPGPLFAKAGSRCLPAASRLWPSSESVSVPEVLEGTRNPGLFVRPASRAVHQFCPAGSQPQQEQTFDARSFREWPRVWVSRGASRDRAQRSAADRFPAFHTWAWRYVQRRPGEAFEVHIVIGQKWANPISSRGAMRTGRLQLQDSRASTEPTALLRNF